MSQPPPQAPDPLSPPQAQLSAAEVSHDPYSIPDTPYISPHSNRATDGNVSAYDPQAYDSEYNMKDLSASNNNRPNIQNQANQNISNPTQQQQPVNNVNTKKPWFTMRHIIITIVVIVIIATVIIIGIHFYSNNNKDSSQQGMSP